MKKIVLSILACLISTCFVSCDLLNSGSGNGDGGDVAGELYEGTVILDAQQGSAARRLVKSDTDWIASNTNTWFVLSTIQGKAGESELGVMANVANEGLKERIGSFKINDEVVYVVQRGVISTSVKFAELLVSPGQKELLIPISGTFPIEEMTVSSNVSWAEFVSVDLTAELEVLADGETESSYQEAAVKIAVKEDNAGAENRNGTVTVVAGEQTLTVNLVQLGNGSGEVDYMKEFFRASVAIKGTGTWCGYCPPMAVQLHETEAEYPDRFYLMNVYNGSGSLTWNEGDALLNHYNLSGFPSGFFNGYAEILSYSSGLADMAEALMFEAVEYYPANVAMAASSEVSDGKVKVEVKMAARSSKEYRVTVYIMENGIVAAQKDNNGILEDPDNFVHDNIVRGTFTEDHVEGGNVVELPLGKVVTKTFEMKVPSNIVDINKTNILAFVTYEGGPNPDAPGVDLAEYKNFGYIIDNAVKIPTVNGKIDFRYEK